MPPTLHQLLTAALVSILLPDHALAATAPVQQDKRLPDFCRKPQAKADQLICTDTALLTAEQQLASVYQTALAKAGKRERKAMAVEQRGWRAGVRDCWKADDLPTCVAQHYELRTVELQTRWQLVPSRGPFTFECPGGAVLTVRYFETLPASLVASYKGEDSLMRIAPAASGARYTGRNESLWEHQGEVRVVWGYGAPEIVCTALTSAFARRDGGH